MFCVEVRNQCRLSTCVVRSFLYLDTDFVDFLFRVPQCYLFRRRTFFAYFKSLIKISKSLKKWNCRNCFRKTGLNTSFSSYLKSLNSIISLNCKRFVYQLTTNFLANYQLTTVFLAKYQLTVSHPLLCAKPPNKVYIISK